MLTEGPSTDPRDRAARAEQQRLAALYSYQVLDTPPEPEYDDLTRLAAHVCAAPIAMITLVDQTRQWFKSRVGMPFQETPRDIAFCGRAIRTPELFEVSDAHADTQFRDNPLVTGAPGIRYYAGVPLETTQGHRLGTLCVIDRKPRMLTSLQRSALRALSRQVVTLLELRRALADGEAVRAALAAESQACATLQTALVRAEAFMRASVDALQDHIAIVDVGGRITHVNRAWSTFAQDNAAPAIVARLGAGADYLAVCDRAAAAGAKDAATVCSALRAALQGDGPGSFSLEYPCHSPQAQRWFIVRISSFGDGAQRYAVVAHQNITERRLVEAQVRSLNQALTTRVVARTEQLEATHLSLRESQERFRTIFDNSTVGFAIADPGGRLVEANPAFGAIVGRSPTDLTAMSFWQLLHEEDASEIRAIRAQLLDGKIPGYVRELRFVRPNGEVVWAHASVASVLDEDGRPAQTMALVQNITARKAAEHERDQFFELSVDMFAIVGFDGRVHRVNVACTQVLGLADSELVGRSYIDLVHPEQRALAREQLAQLAHGTVPPQGKLDLRMQARDGSYREIRWSAAPWLSAGFIIAVGRDITQEREAEHRLRALANRLQTIREEERTRISREIHDELGQLLTALKMDLTLYGRDTLVPATPADRERRGAELGAMISLVDATLQSVRRIAHQLRPELLDALGLLPALEWQARELEQRNDLHCEVRTSGVLPQLDAHRSTALFRIVQEALTNVVRHAQASQVVISLLAQPGRLTLSIHDDGVGFDVSLPQVPSLGLLGMQERAADIGATFDLDSGAAGTTLTVSLPAPAGVEQAPA